MPTVLVPLSHLRVPGELVVVVVVVATAYLELIPTAGLMTWVLVFGIQEGAPQVEGLPIVAAFPDYSFMMGL